MFLKTASMAGEQARWGMHRAEDAFTAAGQFTAESEPAARAEVSTTKLAATSESAGEAQSSAQEVQPLVEGQTLEASPEPAVHDDPSSRTADSRS